MNNILEFTKPAQSWVDGIPMGNGSMGFMHYTEGGREAFSFNHDELFRSHISKKVVVKDKIGEIRALIKNNEHKKAQELFSTVVDGMPETPNPYQPLADLIFDFGEESFKSYCRTLDMEKALLNISCDELKWEAFISNPENVTVIKLTADKKTSLKLFWTREEDKDCVWTTSCNKDQLDFSGEFVEGKKFFASLKIEGDGETVPFDGGIQCSDFTCITLYARVGLGKPCLLEEYDYDEVKNKHITDFSSLYNRFSFSLNCDDITKSEAIYNQAVNERIIQPEMYEYLINMARYVMISSSRDGSKPMNLQGLWCHDLVPDWDCGYTTDINVEMCYWMANPLNIAECQMPLFDWITSNLEKMKEMASDIFGVENAVYIPQYTDLYLTPASWKAYSSFQILWSGAATWIAEHFFEYWKYSGDDSFMLDVAYPYMKMCANFYEQFLVKDSSGTYELIPACNPENWTTDRAQIMTTTAMDVALIQELMDNLIYTNEKLSINDNAIGVYKDIRKNIKPYHINEDGSLSEFTNDDIPRDPSHRHLSHVYGLYPAKTVMGDEKLTEASKKAIENRLEGGLGKSATWSMAWYCALYARLGDGNRALEFVDHIIKSGLMENFLTAHNDWRGDSGYSMFAARKIFQVEGLMGVVAGMSEMLISCTNEKTVILPALPDNWTSGKVKGLCGYDAFEYDIEWNNSKATRIVIHTKKGGSLNLEIATEYTEITCARQYEIKENLITFGNIQKNETIEISVK